MKEYPQELELDTIYCRLPRNGKYVNICFTDQTKEEQMGFLNALTESGLRRMCMELARVARAQGLRSHRLEEAMKQRVLLDSISMKDDFSCMRLNKQAPFGYNLDGTVNEREAEVVRFVFTKSHEYFFNIPQGLLDEAHAWAESEGITLNDEEAADMARARITAYIATEVREKFPDVKFRKAAPSKSKYPFGMKYPSRSYASEEMIDRDLYAQVAAIIAKS